MNREPDEQHWSSEAGVRADLQSQPHLFMKLAENALTVAESLRNNYFKNTAAFVSSLRLSVQRSVSQHDANPVLAIQRVHNAEWSAVQDEVVTFIDGGLGQVQISSQVPILLRVGSYSVRTGEHRLAEREQFGYYPVILGDLEGGSKERKDFPDIVRITAELLAGLAALERMPDLRLLMFHGPLVYLMGNYAGHSPFTEADIDRFLHHYALDQSAGRRLKERFLEQAKLDVYPAMTARSDEWVRRKLFEPLSWMAFLYRQLISLATTRTPRPIIAGVVERGALREFSERILLERIFRRLRQNDRADYFNTMYGRSDLTAPKALLDRLGYTDALLLGMLLRPGEYSEPWEVAKYGGLRHGEVILPGEADASRVNFAPLAPGAMGFPRILGCYVSVSERTEPVRVEVFRDLGAEQMPEAVRRAYLYARLLPGYGFPVGLDVADKFAKVPAWLSDAYGKLIRYHLGVSLQQGEISDAEMRRILVQAIYITHRDWFLRPSS